MDNYEPIAREIFAPLAKNYDLQFSALDNGRFFMIGEGFALYIFVELKERRADTWYVSVDNDGNILTYTLMYMMKRRFTPEDSAYYGNPSALDEYIAANMRVDAAWLKNKCHDILTGDKAWLQGYQGKGHVNRNVTTFLAPYFREQGYPVKIESDG